MSSFNVLKLEYSACVEALTDALRTEDEAGILLKLSITSCTCASRACSRNCAS